MAGSFARRPTPGRCWIGPSPRRPRVLFFPDQHLGRNTARAMGVPLEQMPVWDPRRGAGRQSRRTHRPRAACCYGRGIAASTRCFSRRTSRSFAGSIRASRSWSIPSARWKWSIRPTWSARPAGSFARCEEAPPGTRWAIGTELHLVNRLKHEHPEQEIYFLSPMVCMCATMYRIDLAAFVLGAGESGRRHAGQRDPRRRRNGALGAGSVAADAGSEVRRLSCGSPPQIGGGTVSASRRSSGCKYPRSMSCQPLSAPSNCTKAWPL